MDDQQIEKIIDKFNLSHSATSKSISDYGNEIRKIKTQIETTVSNGKLFLGLITALVGIITTMGLFIYNLQLNSVVSKLDTYMEEDTARAVKTDNKLQAVSDNLLQITTQLKTKQIIYVSAETDFAKKL